MSEYTYTITYQKDKDVPGLMLSWPGFFYMIDFAWIEAQILCNLPIGYDPDPIKKTFSELHRKDLARVAKMRNAKWINVPYNNYPKIEDSYNPIRFSDQEKV